jgi:hypothetical protein
MMKNLVLTLLSISIASQSYAFDVLPRGDAQNEMIKITTTVQNGESLIHFDLCDKVTKECTQIGKQNFYKISDLNEKYKHHENGVVGNVGGLVGIGLCISGPFLGLMYAYDKIDGSGYNSAWVPMLGLPAGFIGGGIAGCIAGGAIGTGANYKNLNIQAIRPEVLQDHFVAVDDVLDFRNELAKALDE